MKQTRNRYQQGSLTIETRKTGPAVWIYRWREADTNGMTMQRKRIVGSKKDFPSKSAAFKAVEGLQLDINTGSAAKRPLTVNQVIAHYTDIELAETDRKTTRTKEVYRHQLQNVISPRWGENRLEDVKAIAVEKWLNEMTCAPGTKAKTKGVLSSLFQHAMRYEWAVANPIRLVRQSAVPQQEEIALAAVEIAALLDELRDPFRTLILLAATTGLRRGELFGLKWGDVYFPEAEFRIVRSLVDQVEGPPKTLASRRPIPMSSRLSEALACWKSRTNFAAPSDWVFASPSANGKLPYWPDAVLKRHVLPAAARAGVRKPIGWHTFRRTLATLLQSSGGVSEDHPRPSATRIPGDDIRRVCQSCRRR